MALEIGITMLIHNKDDIEFVTEFPCFLGHPVPRLPSTRRAINSYNVIGQNINQLKFTCYTYSKSKIRNFKL